MITVILANRNVLIYTLTGEYENTFGSYGCVHSHAPPSAENPICKIFHDKIADIANKFRKSEKRPVIDDDFVKQWLYHQPPAESLLVPTDEIRWVIGWGSATCLDPSKITESLKNNKSYCFSTEVGPFGWCATCKVNTNMPVVLY
jgi:hypothetical protein